MKPAPIIGAPVSTLLGSTPLVTQNIYASRVIFNLSHGCSWLTAVGCGILTAAGRFIAFAFVAFAFVAFAFIAFVFIAFAFIAFAFIVAGRE